MACKFKIYKLNNQVSSKIAYVITRDKIIKLYKVGQKPIQISESLGFGHRLGKAVCKRWSKKQKAVANGG